MDSLPEERRTLTRQAALLIGLVLGVTISVPSCGACFTMRNEDLPEGPWAILAPALVLPCVAICMLSPRVGALAMVALSLVSSIALALWIYRVGWLDGFAVLVMVLPVIAGIGVMFWRAAPPKQTDDVRLNQ